MDLRTVLLGLLSALIATEVLSGCDWIAKRVVEWAGRRWSEREGIDHTREWLEDLEERPGTILKLVTALWLAMATIVPPEWMTLGLPSLWRVTLPFRQTAADVADFLTGLANARVSATGISTQADRLCLLAIRAAASLLPIQERARYLEEWTAELALMPKQAKAGYSISLITGAPRLAVVTRYATRELK
jgi:hypothetical protein